jgi:hypothetical protein
VAVVSVRDTRSAAAAALRKLPALLAGREPDPLGIAREVQLRAGVAALSQVQQAFLIKSRGGTGADGIKWKPLSRKTIAGRRVTRGEKKELGIGGRRVRGLLTPAEDREWRKIYASRLARLRLDLPEPAARARAAQIAWATLKARGARTKLDVLGGRQVDILRDTSRLFRSLNAGVDATPSGEPDQVFELKPGAVIVGTNVVYAGPQHRVRPLWPAGGLSKQQLPAVVRAVRRGALAAIERLLQEG